MSIVLENIDNLILETVIELDDKFIDSYLEEGAIKKAVKYGAAGAVAGAAVHAARVAKGEVGASGTVEAVKTAAKTAYKAATDGGAIGTHGTVAAVKKVGDAIGAGPGMAMGIGGAAAIGAGALASYANSIFRGKYLVSHYTKLLQSASDPAKKQKLQTKLAWAKDKLAKAQAKSRSEHASFIEQSKKMKEMAAQHAKSGNKAAADKLNAKLAKRQKFLSKIGANV